MKNYYPWVLVALLWFVALLNYMDRQMLSTMQEAMKVDISELNQAEAFGALMAVFLWIYGLVSPFAGIIADRANRKWLVVGSIFVWSAVTYLMGYAESFDQLYWLRAFMGISEALYIPAALSLIADWHEGKSRSLAIGIHMTGLYVGQAVGGFGATLAAMKHAQTLRGAGFNVAQFSGSTKLKNQFKRADQSGAAFAVIIAENEVAQNTVTIKDLRGCGASPRFWC